MNARSRFLVDDGLPRLAAERLRRAGIDAIGAEEVGLAGVPDEAVTAYAAATCRVLVTRRAAAGAIERPPSFPGILLLAVPEPISETTACEAIEELVRQYASASTPQLEKP